MKIFVEDVINHPLDAVYKVQRDHMVELSDYLPNIQRIAVLEREDLPDGKVRLLNEWKAAPSEVPTMLRPFVRDEMMQWKDYALWHDAAHKCEWRLEMGFMAERVKVAGSTSYSSIDDKRTKVVISGNLEVDAKGFPGVPRMLAGRIGSEVEKFVIKMVTPNLKGVNRGIEQYLDAR